MIFRKDNVRWRTSRFVNYFPIQEDMHGYVHTHKHMHFQSPYNSNEDFLSIGNIYTITENENLHVQILPTSLKFHPVKDEHLYSRAHN